MPFVVEPHLDGCPVKVVQFCKFFNNSVRWILAVFVQGLEAIFCKCENFALLFAVDEAARFLIPVKQDLQDFQIPGKMRLTQIKESQTKKNGTKKTRKVSFVRNIIVDE